ncbi:MAG: helix-turn-helix domain-containing protein [Armatimonadota bacterium]|nr:helix-turn-helix domain-containing protein [bacterium]
MNTNNTASNSTRFSLRSLEHVKPAYEKLVRDYGRAWGLCCVLTDANGNDVLGQVPCPVSETDHKCSAFRKRAIEEALRWGEPSMLLCPGGFVIWAVPVMENSVVTGGIVAEKVAVGASPKERGTLSPAQTRHAASDLLTMAEEANLTNAALLELRRVAAQRESERAEAIHELKGQNYQSIRDIYLVEEPALIAAIKRGDRPAAREIINRVLVGIYFFGRERPTLLKSFILELVVNMSRSAVEAGGDPTELLGANYSSVVDLSRIDSEEELCAWLVSMLERMMDAIKSNKQYPSTVLLGAALKYMEDHLHEEISRDDVANVACLSPSHFSRVVKQSFGHSFTDLLSRMRVDKARELLTRTEKSLIQICLDCGFSDQSYFTKVFQKYVGKTPGEYRRFRRSSFR